MEGLTFKSEDLLALLSPVGGRPIQEADLDQFLSNSLFSQQSPGYHDAKQYLRTVLASLQPDSFSNGAEQNEYPETGKSANAGSLQADSAEQPAIGSAEQPSTQSTGVVGTNLANAANAARDVNAAVEKLQQLQQDIQMMPALMQGQQGVLASVDQLTSIVTAAATAAATAVMSRSAASPTGHPPAGGRQRAEVSLTPALQSRGTGPANHRDVTVDGRQIAQVQTNLHDYRGQVQAAAASQHPTSSQQHYGMPGGSAVVGQVGNDSAAGSPEPRSSQRIPLRMHRKGQVASQEDARNPEARSQEPQVRRWSEVSLSKENTQASTGNAAQHGSEGRPCNAVDRIPGRGRDDGLFDHMAAAPPARSGPHPPGNPSSRQGSPSQAYGQMQMPRERELQQANAVVPAAAGEVLRHLTNVMDAAGQRTAHVGKQQDARAGTSGKDDNGRRQEQGQKPSAAQSRPAARAAASRSIRPGKQAVPAATAAAQQAQGHKPAPQGSPTANQDAAAQQATDPEQQRQLLQTYEIDVDGTLELRLPNGQTFLQLKPATENTVGSSAAVGNEPATTGSGTPGTAALSVPEQKPAELRPRMQLPPDLAQAVQRTVQYVRDPELLQREHPVTSWRVDRDILQQEATRSVQAQLGGEFNYSSALAELDILRRAAQQLQPAGVAASTGTRPPAVAGADIATVLAGMEAAWQGDEQWEDLDLYAQAIARQVDHRIMTAALELPRSKSPARQMPGLARGPSTQHAPAAAAAPRQLPPIRLAAEEHDQPKPQSGRHKRAAPEAHLPQMEGQAAASTEQPPESSGLHQSVSSPTPATKRQKQRVNYAFGSRVVQPPPPPKPLPRTRPQPQQSPAAAAPTQPPSNQHAPLPPQPPNSNVLPTPQQQEQETSSPGQQEGGEAQLIHKVLATVFKTLLEVVDEEGSDEDDEASEGSPLQHEQGVQQPAAQWYPLPQQQVQLQPPDVHQPRAVAGHGRQFEVVRDIQEPPIPLEPAPQPAPVQAPAQQKAVPAPPPPPAPKPEPQSRALDAIIEEVAMQLLMQQYNREPGSRVTMATPPHPPFVMEEMMQQLLREVLAEEVDSAAAAVAAAQDRFVQSGLQAPAPGSFPSRSDAAADSPLDQALLTSIVDALVSATAPQSTHTETAGTMGSPAGPGTTQSQMLAIAHGGAMPTQGAATTTSLGAAAPMQAMPMSDMPAVASTVGPPAAAAATGAGIAAASADDGSRLAPSTSHAAGQHARPTHQGSADVPQAEAERALPHDMQRQLSEPLPPPPLPQLPQVDNATGPAAGAAPFLPILLPPFAGNGGAQAWCLVPASVLTTLQQPPNPAAPSPSAPAASSKEQRQVVVPQATAAQRPLDVLRQQQASRVRPVRRQRPEFVQRGLDKMRDSSDEDGYGSDGGLNEQELERLRDGAMTPSTLASLASSIEAMLVPRKRPQRPTVPLPQPAPPSIHKEHPLPEAPAPGLAGDWSPSRRPLWRPPVRPQDSTAHRTMLGSISSDNSDYEASSEVSEPGWAGRHRQSRTLSGDDSEVPEDDRRTNFRMGHFAARRKRILQEIGIRDPMLSSRSLSSSTSTSISTPPPERRY